MSNRRRLTYCMVASAGIHVVLLLLVADGRREAERTEAYRARLPYASRFDVRRFLGQRLERPSATRLDDLTAMDPAWEALEPDVSAELPRWSGEPIRPDEWLKRRAQELGARVDTLLAPLSRDEDWPILEGLALPAPALDVADLLSLDDLSRANRETALLIPDQQSPIGFQGYLNIARLRLYNAGNSLAGMIDRLARFATHETPILVRVLEAQHRDFGSEQLLRYPVHFLIEGAGASLISPHPRTRLDSVEKDLLARYLESGGFLFVEGQTYGFLAEMADHLRALLGDDGGMFPLPPAHPIYHAFFDFPGGFPGEQMSFKLLEGHGAPGELHWDYPARQRPPRAAPGEHADGAPPLGLWGVAYGEHVVAVFSDLQLNRGWIGAREGEPEPPVAERAALMAGTNVLVYVLTRDIGRVRRATTWEFGPP